MTPTFHSGTGGGGARCLRAANPAGRHNACPRAFGQPRRRRRGRFSTPPPPPAPRGSQRAALDRISRQQRQSPPPPPRPGPARHPRRAKGRDNGSGPTALHDQRRCTAPGAVGCSAAPRRAGRATRNRSAARRAAPPARGRRPPAAPAAPGRMGAAAACRHALATPSSCGGALRPAPARAGGAPAAARRRRCAAMRPLAVAAADAVAADAPERGPAKVGAATLLPRRHAPPCRARRSPARACTASAHLHTPSLPAAHAVAPGGGDHIGGHAAVVSARSPCLGRTQPGSARAHSQTRAAGSHPHVAAAPTAPRPSPCPPPHSNLHRSTFSALLPELAAQLHISPWQMGELQVTAAPSAPRPPRLAPHELLPALLAPRPAPLPLSMPCPQPHPARPAPPRPPCWGRTCWARSPPACWPTASAASRSCSGASRCGASRPR
jgi:hypothetical protein